MACEAKGKCVYAYIKPGKNTMHCTIQQQAGGQWDFCAHQYYCRQKDHYELSKEADDCTLAENEQQRLVEMGKQALSEAETVFAEELQPKLAAADAGSKSKKGKSPNRTE